MKIRKRQISQALLVVAGLLLCSGLVQAQNERSSISGFVFDPARRPVANVIVELINDYGIAVRRVRTEGSGRFFFTGLGHGRYRVKALPFGTNMEEGSEEVEIAGLGVGGRQVTESVQRDIYLKLRKSAQTAPFQNAVVYAQEVPKDAEKLYKSGVDDLNSKRVDQGVMALEQAIAIFPNYFMALQQLGVTRITQEKWDEAITAFTKAVEVNDRSFDCWYGLAYARHRKAELLPAIAALEKASSLRPESAETFMLIGVTQRQLREFAKAEAAFKQAVKLAAGESADIHWQLALLYAHNLKRYADAAKELELYLKTAGDIPEKAKVQKLIKEFKEKAKTEG